MVNIYFIDFYWKGIRVRKWHNYLVLKALISLYIFFFVVLFIFKIKSLNYTFNFSNPQSFPIGEIGQFLLIDLVVALVAVGISYFLAIPIFKRFLLLQRLYDLIMSSQFYLVNNIENKRTGGFDKGRVKREVAYFPKFYLKMKSDKVYITIRLDGSKFHKTNEYHQLGGIIEEYLDIDFCDMYERKNFLTFEFAKNNALNRLMIENIQENVKSDCVSEIPLMNDVYWNIAKNPNALITGARGGGKTFFLMYLIEQLIKREAELFICDPKRADLLDYEGVLPNVAGDRESIEQAVKHCVDVMNERYFSIKQRSDYQTGEDWTYYGLTPIVLIIDELTAYMAQYEKSAEQKKIMNLIRQIVLMGRQVGVMLVTATQRADVEALPGDIRDQLGLRMTLGQMSADGYRMTFGNLLQKLRNKLETGRGYYLFLGQRFVKEYYAPLIPKDYPFIERAKLLLRGEQRF